MEVKRREKMGKVSKRGLGVGKHLICLVSGYVLFKVVEREELGD